MTSAARALQHVQSVPFSIFSCGKLQYVCHRMSITYGTLPRKLPLTTFEFTKQKISKALSFPVPFKGIKKSSAVLPQKLEVTYFTSNSHSEGLGGCSLYGAQNILWRRGEHSSLHPRKVGCMARHPYPLFTETTEMEYVTL